LLTIAAFFLSENGRINTFPTYGVGLVLIVLLVLDKSLLRHFGGRLPIAIATLLAYFSLSPLWADNGNLSLTLLYLGYAILIVAFLGSIVLLQLHYVEFVRFLVWLTVLAAVVSATYSIQLHYAYPEFQPLREDRLFALGRLHNPVVGGLSYGIAMVMTLHLAIQGRSSNDRFLALFCLLILLVAVVLTNTRSLWVGLSAAVMYAIGVHLPTSRGLKILVAAMLLAVICGIVIGSMGWDELLKRSTSFRPEIWQGLITRALDNNWLIGGGITADSSLAYGVFNFQHAHSVYVATFYYGGLFGLTLLAALLYVCFGSLIRSEQSDLQTLAALLLVYSVVVIFFDGDRFLTKVDYLWVVFWLPIAIVLIVDRENPSVIS
jgi:O-antigen ligase